MTDKTTPAAESGDFLTPAELAARWKGRVSVGTLRNWRGKGIGPTYTKLGGRGILYPIEAVKAFERSRQAGAEAAE